MVSSPPRVIAASFALDAASVVGFAALGRATHDGDVFGPGGLGLAETAWPFLVALVAGWVAALAWRRPLCPLRTGVPVWLVTVVGGMLLRGASGQGTALPFVIVATIVLALLLVGWRTVVAVATRRRAPR